MELWHEFNNLDAKEYARQHPALFDYVREQMATPDKKYLLLGDTNHSNKHIQDFLYSPTIAALFNYASIPNVCLEAPREMITNKSLSTYRSLMAQFRNAEITSSDLAMGEQDFWKNVLQDQEFWASQFEIKGDSSACRRRYETIEHIKQVTEQKENASKAIQDIKNRVIRNKRNFWGKRFLGFTHAALNVQAVDSWQWRPSLVPSLAERVFLGDREVADYIQKQVHDEKASVIYGNGHLDYKSGLTDHLQRDKCLLIHIYSDRDMYINMNEKLSIQADFIPDKIYLVEEDVLEIPNPKHYCIGEDKLSDHYQSLKSYANSIYGPNASLENKARARSRITMLRNTDKKYFDYLPT